jgi:hypothetical protein
MGEERRVYKVSVGKQKGKRPQEDQGIDGRMGSERVLGSLARRARIEFDWLRIGTGGEW